MRRFPLRLYADQLAPKSEMRLPGCNRAVYVREGDAVLRAGGQASGLATDSAWQGSGEAAVTAGVSGATLLRWELAPANSQPGTLTEAGVISALTLSRSIGLEEPGGYLMRCDRVDFPPGGIAYTHVHRGPGIRWLLRGAIRVEVNGKPHDIAPGNAWFEAGPDPVLALASKTEPTAFVRVMILPRELKGKSSIRYVKPEDAEKPRTQTYRIFSDEFIELP